MIAVTAAGHTDIDIAVLAAAAAVIFGRRGRARRYARKATRSVAAVAAVALTANLAGTAAAILLALVFAAVWLAHRHKRSRYRHQAKFMRHVWKHINRAGGLGGNVTYEKWMASSGWRRQKQAALERANFRCEIRGCNEGRLEVHHNNNDVYKHLPKARPSDLNVLCASHHRLVTNLHQHHGYTIAQATRRVMQNDVYAA